MNIAADEFTVFSFDCVRFVPGGFVFLFTGWESGMLIGIVIIMKKLVIRSPIKISRILSIHMSCHINLKIKSV